MVVDTFACNPGTALKLATLKVFTTAGSNQALLAPDPTAPASRVVAGVPLLTSPSIGNDIVWSLPRARIILALRQGTARRVRPAVRGEPTEAERPLPEPGVSSRRAR